MAAKRLRLEDLSPAARNARITKLARNAGTRSKIPDKYLPAQYKTARANAQRVKQENATIYNPGVVLSGNDLRNAVKSSVDMQIGPQIAAADRAISQTTGARDSALSRQAGYADLYNKSTAGAAAALSSSGQQLAEKLAALGSNTGAQIQGFQNEANQRFAADAALRGPGLTDPSAANAEFATEKAFAAGQAGTFGGQGIAQAGGFAGLGNTIAATAPMRANDNMTLLANTFNKQLAEMYGKRQDAEASRGPLTAETTSKMRQDQFTNLATMKGLGIKEADLAETTRKNKATERLTGLAINQRNLASIRTANTSREKATADKAYKQAQIDIKRGIDPVTGKPLPKKPQSTENALNAWKLKFAQAHGYLPQTGPGKGAKGAKPPLTPNEVNTQIKGYEQAHSAVLSGIGALGGTGKVPRAKAAATFMASDAAKRLDPLYASVAFDIAYDGHVSRANASKLHKRHLTVKDLGLPSYADWKRKNKNVRPSDSIPGFGGATARLG